MARAYTSKNEIAVAWIFYNMVFTRDRNDTSHSGDVFGTILNFKVGLARELTRVGSKKRKRIITVPERKGASNFESELKRINRARKSSYLLFLKVADKEICFQTEFWAGCSLKLRIEFGVRRHLMV